MDIMLLSMTVSTLASGFTAVWGGFARVEKYSLNYWPVTMDLPRRPGFYVVVYPDKKTDILLRRVDDHGNVSQLTYSEYRQMVRWRAFLWPSLVRPRDSSADQRREGGLAKIVVGLASFTAVGLRPTLRLDWMAEHAAAEAGEIRTRRARLRFSIGLLRAALVMRRARLAAPLIAALDKVAVSERRSRQAVFTVVFCAAAVVFHKDGFAAVLESWESMAALGGCVYTSCRWRRKTLKERSAIAGMENSEK